ncbi:hypothetical protein D3C72_2168580 [compost metagenome]
MRAKSLGERIVRQPRCVAVAIRHDLLGVDEPRLKCALRCRIRCGPIGAISVFFAGNYLEQLLQETHGSDLLEGGIDGAMLERIHKNFKV